MTNKEFLHIIRTNIDEIGYHLTLVNGGQHPDFSYSIGLTEKLGFELIIAGGGFISIEENESVFNGIFNKLKSGHLVDSEFFLPNNDSYYLTKVDSSWIKKLMLGVYDYYNVNEIIAYQIIPEDRTMDTLLMSEPMIPKDPIWKWLDINWDLDAPKNSYVITDIDSLKGKTIIELTRWEEHVWEMFSGAGPDVSENDIRTVPLGTILGIDSTLEVITKLTVGQGLWRDNKYSSWQDW
ncbi:DUF4262 domain-containing protein [Pedobacter sp. FW305-3-2-15-E-R2A2]|uniref:DUF4262 domain-containing protein n=1 Tax=Pedobacter sp. FW305-3-2-15-E-R2A2 TaxID=3140251 RepID=UPI0031402A0F